MVRELFLVVFEDLLIALGDVRLLVPGEYGELWAPPGLYVEGDAGGHDDGSGEEGGVVFLEGVLLEGEVAEELGVLLDVLGDLLDELPSLPPVLLKGDTLTEVVTNDVEGADGAEGPVEVHKDFALPIAEGKGGEAGGGELGDLKQLGDGRAVLRGAKRRVEVC